MIEKFKQLESVKGLRSVLAVEAAKQSLVYSSPSVNKGLASALLTELLQFTKNYPSPVKQLIINYSDSRLLLYTLKEHLLVLHVEEDFRVQEMKRALQEKHEAKPVITETNQLRESVLNKLENQAISGDDLLVYQSIITTLKDYACEQLGAFVAANKLRESKEKLHGAYKILQSFIVGKDGSTAFRNTPESSVGMSSQAIAAWALLFFKKCQEIIPAFEPDKILQLISSQKSQWQPLGFHEAWEEEKLVSELDV